MSVLWQSWAAEWQSSHWQTQLFLTPQELWKAVKPTREFSLKITNPVGRKLQAYCICFPPPTVKHLETAAERSRETVPGGRVWQRNTDLQSDVICPSKEDVAATKLVTITLAQDG